MRKKLLSILLALTLTLGCITGAFADFSDFTDISGHWSESMMQKAYADGLIEGFEDNTIRPNNKITVAQMITILCRVLGTEKQDSISVLGLTGAEWFADAAGQALHLGLIDENIGDLDAYMTRLEALKMLSRAFQLSKAEPDYAAAESFSDFSTVSGEDARIIASLVEAGLIEGYNGSLTLSSSITRAEFMTVLYRIAENFVTADRANGLSGSAVLSGAAALNGQNFSGSIWLGANANRVSLSNVKAPVLVIRSENVSAYSFYNNNIDRYVIANNTGSLTCSFDYLGSVDCVAVGDGSDTVTLSGNLNTIETIGSNRKVNIMSSADELLISGSGNTVTIYAGTSVDTVRISGENNTVILNGRATELSVGGSGSIVSGSGYAGAYRLTAVEADVKISHGEYIDDREPGIRDAVLELTCPEELPVDAALEAKVTFSGIIDPVVCTGTWYVDDKAVHTELVTVSDGGSCSLTYKFNYEPDMADSSVVSFVLDHTTSIGEVQQHSVSAIVAVEVPDAEYFEKYEVNRVLSTVTSAYAGNYTTQWALDNDYDQRTKTIWVNAKGYSSTSQYLIWINLTYQRVNIFEGSKGNWTLIHEYLGASGAGDCTPRGVFTVFGRSAAGWTTATYNCRPVVNFKVGTGYAFHSRLYDPTHSYLTDPSIGFPVSHGCIRMYDEDVQWMYNNIPIGTTVVVH